ncbi:MAG: hypothetical protein AUH25_05610 [Thaumarchaeota archaeon 13_1_40CM_38_12]|nr:MAG: hypothetical protein AUH25_05610 [Thaumarchaeota archaeon 13_1_40CM_38_12]
MRTSSQNRDHAGSMLCDKGKTLSAQATNGQSQAMMTMVIIAWCIALTRGVQITRNCMIEFFSAIAKIDKT